MSDINVITINGRLGNDAQVKYTKSSGNKFLKFTLANNTYFNGDTNVSWFSVMVFGHQNWIGSLEKLLVKGVLVTVQGRFLQNNYENSSGELVKSYFIRAEAVQVMSHTAKKEREELEVREENPFIHEDEEDVIPIFGGN